MTPESSRTRGRAGKSRDHVARGVACRVMKLRSGESMMSIDQFQLAHVMGGSDFGRCGPGSSWKWLGNVFTPACARHDAAVRGALANGSSNVMAHVRALPLLPAAIGSYVSATLG